MDLGFMTSCLPARSLDQVAEVAQQLGYNKLEVATWPSPAAHEYAVAHIDAAAPDPDKVWATLDAHGIGISALSYFENNLHPDPEERSRINAHLSRCVDAAAALGVPTVSTFIGRDPSLSVAENLKLATTVFPPLTAQAAERGVKIAIENCPMEGWHVDGYPGNLAYCPELWEFMFSELDLYLNYDPSHLLWLGIEAVEVIAPYIDRIPHWQAKDVEIFPDRRNRTGHFGKTIERINQWDAGWWRYRVPGLGEVDWRRVIDRFYELGYRGTVSVEHEDPVWGGDEDRVVTGLQIAQRTLSALLVIN
jgi:sugar phosphate isomerase/epimerase